MEDPAPIAGFEGLWWAPCQRYACDVVCQVRWLPKQENCDIQPDMVERATVSSPTEIREFLRPLVPGLSEEDLGELARAAAVRPFPAGATVCREGEPGRAIYVVVEGRVVVVKQLTDDTERHLDDMYAGDILGEIAVLQAGTRTATVRAVEPTTLLEIDQEPFLAILGRSPALGIRILVKLTQRFRDADRQAITLLREANEDIGRALHKLERLDHTKSDFIQVSAHELRTPVAALMGYAQMMRSNALLQGDSELRVLVDGVVASTERLHRVFNTILDASRVMTDTLQVTRSPISIPVIFDGLASEYEPALRERDVTLVLTGMEHLPYCYGAPHLLYKSFHHLLNNALKYTPDGGRITVAAELLNDSELGETIQITVEDSGIGIAPEDLDLIFERYYRTGEVALYSSGTTSFKGGGPGLGLTIARGIVEAHGGRIWAESPGYDEEACPGSCFIVLLPVSPVIFRRPRMGTD